MEIINLAGHFDGERIQLDEPFDLAPNTPLIITVLPPGVPQEDASWAVTASMGLSQAYGEGEPDYSVDDLK
jgi:hypothetical protein